MLVCGGRDYRDFAKLCMALDRASHHKAITLLIHGDAPGADRLARDWAIARGIPHQAYPADWDAHGKAAGPIRNSKMLLAEPDGVMAFPGGPGTADMVRQAQAAWVPIWKPYG